MLEHYLTRTHHIKLLDKPQKISGEKANKYKVEFKKNQQLMKSQLFDNPNYQKILITRESYQS